MTILAARDELAELLKGRRHDLRADAVRVHVDRIQFGRCSHVEGRLREDLSLPLGRALDDFDVGVVGQIVVEAAAAKLSHILPQVALKFKHGASRFAVAILKERDELLGGLLTGQIVVGLHGHVDLAADGGAVDGVEGDARVPGALHGGADRLAVDRDGDDGVHAQRDEVVDLVGLDLGVEVGVGRRDFPALGLSRVHQAAHDDALAAAQLRRAIADGDGALSRRFFFGRSSLFFGSGFLGFFRRGCLAAASGQRQQQDHKESEQYLFRHLFSSSFCVVVDRSNVAKPYVLCDWHSSLTKLVASRRSRAQQVRRGF